METELEKLVKWFTDEQEYCCPGCVDVFNTKARALLAAEKAAVEKVQEPTECNTCGDACNIIYGFKCKAQKPSATADRRLIKELKELLLLRKSAGQSQCCDIWTEEINTILSHYTPALLEKSTQGEADKGYWWCQKRVTELMDLEDKIDHCSIKYTSKEVNDLLYIALQKCKNITQNEIHNLLQMRQQRS